MCGYRGYRPLADFSQHHWQIRVPIAETPRQHWHSVLINVSASVTTVEFEPFVELFNRWSQLFIPLRQETWVAADGKSIKSTLTDYSELYQNFISSGARLDASSPSASSGLGIRRFFGAATAVGRLELPDLGGTVGNSLGSAVSRPDWLARRLGVKRR